MNRRILAALGVAGLLMTGSAGTALAKPAPPTPDKVTICQATRSVTHPYVTITVSKSALDAHKTHQDRRDLIPAPAKGCPSDQTFPGVDPYTGPFVPCVVSVGMLQTPTTVTGTSADDTIDCTNASPGEWILGLDGNDTITGGPGVDYVEGNAGNDTLTGSAGDDTLLAGSGNDTLSGGVGNDTLLAQPSDAGADTLNGDADNDTCSAVTAEGDTLTGCES
jgi:hypothetical protein